MKRTSEASAEFVIEFASLAGKLAAIDVVIARLHLEFSIFGCWTMVATKREEAVQLCYDGRDSYITIEVSPIRKHSTPNEWVHVETKGINNRTTEALDYAEAFLRKRFTV